MKHFFELPPVRGRTHKCNYTCEVALQLRDAVSSGKVPMEMMLQSPLLITACIILKLLL